MRLINIGSVRKSFIDMFTNTGSLDRSSTDGTLWNILRGVWSTASGRLSSSTSASAYPLATVNTASSDVVISVKDVTQGTSAALWVTDSGNWWAVGIDQISEDCNCQTCAVPGNCANYNSQCNAASYPCATWSYQCNAFGFSCPCGSYNFGNCNNNIRYPQVGPGQWIYSCNVTGNRYCTCPAYPCNSASYPCNATNYVCNSVSYPCAAYNATTYVSCNCQTCYPQYVRFIKSVSNTVTQLTSWLISNVVKSFKVTTSSSQTTIKVYSDSSMVSQIGSDLTYTPTGVAINPQYGIMIKPSTYSQGNSIDEISIEVN